MARAPAIAMRLVHHCRLTLSELAASGDLAHSSTRLEQVNSPLQYPPAAGVPSLHASAPVVAGDFSHPVTTVKFEFQLHWQHQDLV